MDVKESQTGKNLLALAALLLNGDVPSEAQLRSDVMRVYRGANYEAPEGWAWPQSTPGAPACSNARGHGPLKRAGKPCPECSFGALDTNTGGPLSET